MILSDFVGHFGCCKRFRCLYLKNAAYMMYESTTVARPAVRAIISTSHSTSYDTERRSERDLLAVAKFLLLSVGG